MPKRKMSNRDILLKMRMLGAYNFSLVPRPQGSPPRSYDFRIIDIHDGTVLRVIRSTGYSESGIVRAHKQQFMAALTSHGNTSARYQIITGEVFNKYQKGEYRVDTEVQIAVERARKEAAMKQRVIRQKRNEEKQRRKKHEQKSS